MLSYTRLSFLNRVKKEQLHHSPCHYQLPNGIMDSCFILTSLGLKNSKISEAHRDCLGLGKFVRFYHLGFLAIRNLNF